MVTHPCSPTGSSTLTSSYISFLWIINFIVFFNKEFNSINLASTSNLLSSTSLPANDFVSSIRKRKNKQTKNKTLEGMKVADDLVVAIPGSIRIP